MGIIIDKEIQKLIASKVKNQFGNSDDLDVKIEKKNGQATNVFVIGVEVELINI